jgi:hypothetical protein
MNESEQKTQLKPLEVKTIGPDYLFKGMPLFASVFLSPDKVVLAGGGGVAGTGVSSGLVRTLTLSTQISIGSCTDQRKEFTASHIHRFERPDRL